MYLQNQKREKIMTKANQRAMADQLIQEFLKNGGTITKVPATVVKVRHIAGQKWASIAHTGRKQITMARLMGQGV